MSAMMLVVTVAGRRAALPADRVNSVVELAGVVPVPRAPAHIAGVGALRSRPLTIVDCRAALGFQAGEGEGEGGRAVVVEHGGHLYGLKVDGADDIAAAAEGPAQSMAEPGPGWNRASTGMVETSAGPLLVLDIARLVEGCAARAAA